jgi:hypothetical protein
VKFYNNRGTAEQWIKEGKYVLKWTGIERKVGHKKACIPADLQ